MAGSTRSSQAKGRSKTRKKFLLEEKEFTRCATLSQQRRDLLLARFAASVIAVQTSREQVWLSDPRLLVPHGGQALDAGVAKPGKRSDTEWRGGAGFALRLNRDKIDPITP